MSRPSIALVARTALVALSLASAACSKQKPRYFGEYARMARVHVDAAAGHAPASPHASAIPVELAEWKVSIAAEALPAGATTFEVHNTGTMPHAFEIEGNGIEVRTKQIEPGKVATLSVKLAKGTYELYCPVGGGSHKKMGMHADLNVTE
jgi:plastocyanin